MGTTTFNRRLLIGGLAAALLLVGLGVAFALFTWGALDRVAIDRPEVQGSGGAVASGDQTGSGQSDADAAPEDFFGHQVVLLVGSDSRDDLEDLEDFGAFEGRRADVVMVFLKSGGRIGLLSLPRDLAVKSLCNGGETRLNMMLEGCDGLMNGPTLLTLVVEELIGESVNHFAMVDLAGFQEAVDALGGYEICVTRPVRDILSGLDLPSGCTLADGEQTLAWLRSRHTQELTEAGWRPMAGTNDLVRNDRQRKFLIDLTGRLSDFSSPQDIAATASAVAPYVTVDSNLSLVSAVDFAWALRGLESGAVEELEVPVYDDVTRQGVAILRTSEPIDEIVAEFLGSGTAEGSQQAG
ncbi:MAG: LCP family protein [Acidimicrobiia bacterium]